MKRERVILGKDCIYSSDSAETGINGNVLAVGGAGSGKTFNIVQMELLETLSAEHPLNRIVICTKRGIPERFIPAFREAGFHVYDLNFADPDKGNCCYDPMKFVRNGEDITELARSIVMADSRKENSTADPFWDQASIALLGAEIGAIRIRNEKFSSFAEVLELHRKVQFVETGLGRRTTIDPFMDCVGKMDTSGYVLSCWKTFKEAADKTARSIYVTMNSDLNAFTPAILESMQSKPAVSMRAMQKERSILFVTTSPVKKALHGLANIFVAQALSELFTIAENEPSGKLPIETHLSFDDFATGARVAEMPEKLSILREKGISCTLLLQSEAQLEKMYGHWGAIEIMDNCDSYVFFGGNNYETARSISLRLNAPLEDVLYMPVGREIVFRRGRRPQITSRYNVCADERYRNLEKIQKAPDGREK